MHLELPSVTRESLSAALEGLTALAVQEIASGKVPRPLYESAVKYRRESPDIWSPPSRVLARGYGDCEDLACWRAAELQLAGVPARAEARRASRRMWHVIVRHPDGTEEDPSKQLGMKGRA